MGSSHVGWLLPPSAATLVASEPLELVEDGGEPPHGGLQLIRGASHSAENVDDLGCGVWAGVG